MCRMGLLSGVDRDERSRTPQGGRPRANSAASQRWWGCSRQDPSHGDRHDANDDLIVVHDFGEPDVCEAAQSCASVERGELGSR